MDKVSVFESSDFGELRIIVDPKGDVWFVASDVAKSLGYINAKDAVKRHVDDDDSMLLQVSDNQWGVKRSILKTRYIDSIRIINRPHQPTNIPSGAVFCGLRHCSIISQFAAYGIAHKNRSVQGFLTSKNRFLTREDASELVKSNNQEMVVDRSAIREQLYSEDLY